jgi:hypothetical protein
VEIGDGFGVKVTKGGAPSKPSPLPIAPVWSGPERRTIVVTETAADATLLFDASTVSGTPAASWRVQLAKDAAFDDVVVDTAMPLGDRRLEAKALATGTYHARVSAVDADRRLRALRAGRARAPPPIGRGSGN